MEQKEETAQKLLRLAYAYKGVFGVDGFRTADQQLVWDDLRARSCKDAPIFHPDRMGEFSSLRAAHIDGARTLFIGIERQLRNATRQPEDKPKVIKANRKKEENK